MIEELFAIEKETYRDSPLHRLDARVKLIVAFAAIIALVSYPVSTPVYLLGAVFALFYLVLWVISGLSPLVYMARLLLILPFGLSIMVLQIFFPNRFFPGTVALFSLPLGITVYAGSVQFALILFVKFLLCISFIILLSSTTRVQDMLVGARRLGFPSEFTLIMGMMIRYLFVFGQMFFRIRNALETRCFNAFDRSLPYMYRMRQMGYTIGTMFIRSYEQGERVYTSMLCRGYGRDSYLFVERKPLKGSEWVFLSLALLFIVTVPLSVWLTSFRLF